MEPFIGEITLCGYNFAPWGWAFCNGQLLPISQHQALFAVIGRTYGGDGFSTFALPDLRDRIVMGVDPDDPDYALGATGGVSTITPPSVVAAAGKDTAEDVAVWKPNAIDNQPQYQKLHFIIALTGIFPSRD